MKFNELLEELLLEITAKEMYDKYYSKIPYDTFVTIVSADPKTVFENNDFKKIGKYSKLLLLLYQNNGLRIEDLDKAKEYLEYIYKYNIPVDTNKIKQLADLYNLIKDRVAKETKQLNDILSSLKPNEYKKLFDGKDWVIYQPITEKASCYLGASTEWCTTWGKYSLDKRYRDRENHFKKHASQGPLFIIINKNNQSEKYQFHFETKQYMDKDDSRIDKNFFDDASKKEILYYFFPSLVKKVTEEEFIKEITKIDILPESLVSKFLKKSVSLIKNDLIRVIATNDNEKLNDLVKDERITFSLYVDENRIKFETKKIFDELENYESKVGWYEYETNNGYEHTYNWIRDMDDDNLQDSLIDYLKGYYEDNKEDFRIHFGLMDFEKFKDFFIKDFSSDNKIKETFFDDISVLSSENYEQKNQEEVDVYNEYLKIDKRSYSCDYSLSKTKFILFLLKKNIQKIENMEQTLVDYLEDNNLNNEYDLIYDFDWEYPIYKKKGYGMDDATDKFFEQYLDDEGKNAKCVNNKIKFNNIYTKFFKENDFYDTEDFSVKLLSTTVDCSTESVQVEYVNKKTNKKYKGGVKIDNLVSLLVNRKLFETQMSFKRLI